MDPSTGTFISMDSYAGTIYDPVSLHKYLYANANPVMNTDPSGYFSLSECIVTVGQKISMVNQKIHEIKTLQKMMNTANALCTVYDMLTMMKEVWLEERSIVDVALVLLRGIAIGYLINCACGTQLGVVLKPVLGALGVKSNVDELVEAINNRDVVEIIVRSVQLVCAIFGLTAQCFTGDTLISTENGLVPIEDIKVGNLVWTENIETGEQELKEVTKVYVNKTDKILHLTIEKEGDIETIDTTEGHPFYVEGKGWVRAGVLQKGDVLTSETGTAVVVSKQTESLSVPKIIYNLEVADNHTYYASEEKVLVHNSESSGCSVETSADSEGERTSIKKSNHAIIRSGQGRNVNTAINDINKSSPSKIFLQDDGRIVIKGDRGRVHILESDGEIVTTMNKVTNFIDRVLSGRYKPLTETERIEFVSKFDEYLGKAWDEYRDLN